MHRRFVLAALGLAAAFPALAQEAAAPLEPAPALAHVRLQTSEGDILLALEKDRAPVTTANFLRYVDQKRLDGTSFYRATRVAPGFGLIQGGARNDPRRALPPIAHEPTSKTGLTHADGTISMARAAPGSATGDFFITVGAMPTMDADPSQPGDNLGFAAFGRVEQGMDVVHRILDAPVSPTEGEGAMRGQMLASPVKIITARRVD
ncbi:peptidylprolyl isomerase [Edaphosphingomonas haloaromaticamans]|uniref:peptidylprolyl isomerase n=1 Tax=Edaphosphingomonas haloaromaticamans TaxID=653954 RepID=A0A1S1HLL5_9SPHN|nr:peptidylprolyl isomerase [Sphingomonas haloaromaticamans]OHT21420.1 Peptidyl-prolyl cis-trans isomerase A precursor [Sphingomonas haloaromaticamans]